MLDEPSPDPQGGPRAPGGETERAASLRGAATLTREGFLVAEVVVDEEGRPIDLAYTEENLAALALTDVSGYVGRRLRDVEPVVDQSWLEAWERVVRTRVPERLERYFAPADRWFDCYLTPMGADPGRRAALIFHDITGRRRAEAALRENETRQQFLLALNDRLRPLVDPVEIQYEASCALGRHLSASRVGYGEDQGDGETIVVARNYTDGGGGVEGRYRYDSFGSRLLADLATGRTVVHRDVARDDRLTDAEKAAYAALDVAAAVEVPLVKGDRLVAVLFVHRREARDWSVADLELIDAVAARTWDAVERARVEGALREREERYRTLFESIDEGFCILQMILDDAGRPSDYRFLESNPVFERETGLRDAVGRTARELVPNLEQYWIDVYGRVALTGEPVRFVQHAPSMGRWFDVNALRLGAPENLQVALLFNDITERRRTEEEREAQLERERLAREAAEAFLAVMSHELRTPVTSIYGTASLLARNPRRADLVDLVADIQEEAERLQRIIDDLLVLSGVERGLLQLAPEPILLQRTIAEILADMRRRFPTVVFAAQIPGSLSPITADATALRQVLHNLVSNAAKYAGRDGPVTLTVTDADPEITVTVLDEGPGLGADPAALFGLFYRAPHTAKLAAGTGIGLYVANALLRAMGSRIEASTREPRGACFRFSLPKAVDD